MNRGKVETELRRGPKSAGEGKRNGLEDAAVKQSETFGRIVRCADKVGAQRSMKLS
jgi:hypothetical protein